MPRGMCPPWRTPLREFLETAADVGARVRSGVAAAQAEQAAVLVLVAVTTTAQHDTTGAVVAIIRNVSRLTACNSRRIECPFEPTRRRRSPGRDVTARSGSCSDFRASACVRVGRRLLDAVDGRTAEVNAIDPVIDIAPQVLNPSVLTADTVGAATRFRRASVVLHTVCRTHILRAGVVATAISDGFLGVPVGKLHEVEHINRPQHRKVELPDG